VSAGYDPLARRDTPLAGKLRELIARQGPIPIHRYWQACLSDPEHGYYRHREVIGRSGDFVTAPEISQVFGELIGLWCAVVWQQMGAPPIVNLIELGPGRGTMMRDMVRAISIVPDFARAVRIFLVEQSEVLRRLQSETLSGVGVPVAHLEAPQEPEGPTIVIANEFLDCLPIAQLEAVAVADGMIRWHERAVGVDDQGRLQVVLGRAARLREATTGLPAARPGDILEDRRANGVAESLVRAAGRAPLAALFIDYGHALTAYGDTLQAVRAHAHEHPLTSPGEADLTSQVDFAAFASLVHEAATRSKSDVAMDGPATQAEFLGRLGVVERAQRLMSGNPAKAGAIEAGVARLLAVPGMGDRFKALGVRSAGLPALPGFL
jgi:SAM-dependent MidA family methyltransferase